ncbi:MAG: hypothetical protein AAFP82_18905, partial [Bacteroidota bacterium]
AYRDGSYSLKTFQVEGNDQQFTLSRQQQGTYQESYETFSICVYGLPFKVSNCKVDDQETSFSWIEETGYIEITVNKDFSMMTLS